MVLIATLFPVPGGGSAAEPIERCFVCGERALADALANVLLFLPLGAALAWRQVGAWWAVAIGAVLSIGIELLQHAVPGRDPNPSDVLFNTLGTVAGIVAWRGAWRHAATLRSGLDVLAPSLAAATLLLLAAGGWLLQSSVPAGDLHVEWTPEIPGLARFPGEVLEANVGSVRLEPGLVADPGAVRDQLRRGGAIRVVATRGTSQPRLAPILRLRRHEGEQVVLVASAGNSVIVQLRTRAAALRLDQPHLRAEDALRNVSPGGLLRVRVWPVRQGYCVEVNGVSDCGLGFTLGDSWGILLYPRSLGSTARVVFALAWLALLFLPTGLAARRPLGVMLTGAGIIGGLLILPRLVEIAPTPASQVVAALSGLALGGLLGRGRVLYVLRRGDAQLRRGSDRDRAAAHGECSSRSSMKLLG